MKANELRIGNLVYPNDENGTPYPVTEIRESSICCTNKENDDYDWCIPEVVISLDSIDPIPLTEEWIVKFGFGKIKAHDKFYWFALNINDENFQHPFFHYNPSDKFATLCSPESESTIIEILYVHQLQNLYFALTGEELTIKN